MKIWLIFLHTAYTQYRPVLAICYCSTVLELISTLPYVPTLVPRQQMYKALAKRMQHVGTTSQFHANSTPNPCPDWPAFEARGEITAFSRVQTRSQSQRGHLRKTRDWMRSRSCSAGRTRGNLRLQCRSEDVRLVTLLYSSSSTVLPY